MPTSLKVVCLGCVIKEHGAEAVRVITLGRITDKYLLNTEFRALTRQTRLRTETQTRLSRSKGA